MTTAFQNCYVAMELAGDAVWWGLRGARLARLSSLVGVVGCCVAVVVWSFDLLFPPATPTTLHQAGHFGFMS